MASTIEDGIKSETYSIFPLNLKQLKNTIDPQLNVRVKSSLQQKNVTYEDNVYIRDEKENVDEFQSSSDISSEQLNSFKSSTSRNIDEVVRPSCSTLLSPSCLHRTNLRNYKTDYRQLYNSRKTMSQDANDVESLSFDINKSITEIKSICKTIFVRVEEINSKVDVTIMNRTRLNRSLLPAEKRIIRPPDLPALPVYTEDGLKALEIFLEDNSNLSAMIHYLASFSLNKTEGKAAAQVMTKLITNTLACSYNFKGTDGSGKKAFQKLHLWEVVQGVVQIRFPESNLSDTKDSVMSWLRNAPWRKQEIESESGKRKSNNFHKRNMP